MSSSDQSCLLCGMPSQGYAFCSEQCRVLDWDKSHEAARSVQISALASMLSYEPNNSVRVPHSRRTVLPFHHHNIPPPLEEHSTFSSDSSDDSDTDSDASFWESPTTQPQDATRDPSNILRAKDILQKYISAEESKQHSPTCQRSQRASNVRLSMRRHTIGTRQPEIFETGSLTTSDNINQNVTGNDDHLETSNTNINEAKEILKKYLHVRKVHPETYMALCRQKTLKRRSSRGTRFLKGPIDRHDDNNTAFNCIESGLCEHCKEDEEQQNLSARSRPRLTQQSVSDSLLDYDFPKPPSTTSIPPLMLPPSLPPSLSSSLSTPYPSSTSISSLNVLVSKGRSKSLPDILPAIRLPASFSPVNWDDLDFAKLDSTENKRKSNVLDHVDCGCFCQVGNGSLCLGGNYWG
ncbi:hypothetical protein BP6252_05741 [Coleophoma cylindrospora]|uniref:Uncharacterized protein n=1 Tax=Coleophoma cylindrospora TaxID=1849047 RepID=A0A3D8RUN4_9HELO|nr:hypothetical protein BP6252_05741 [Coleophoma cylindrospora]